MTTFDRRTFTVGASAGLAAALSPNLAWLAAAAEPTASSPAEAVGPMVGHVTPASARIWYRPAQPGRYQITVSADGVQRTAIAEAADERDRGTVWTVDGLVASQQYEYSISSESHDETLARGTFSTPPDDKTPSRIALAWGSCAHNKPLELWQQIREAGVGGLVLLGDTPYIDSTDLSVARRKHRDFLAVPQLASLIKTTPTWGTWDDHDFGANDSDGTLPGKSNTRQAFLEYRANEGYGHGDEGIYTSFRYGPVEVFLLDTRWFARTEPSPVDPTKPTLLGRVQWDWLKTSLKQSTAPFKIIACGMIWDDKKNRESDDWGHYTHERTALFEFLGQEAISGAILIGGDIHCSRLLRYKTEATVGYPLYQMIVSPIHDRTIPSLNVPHPDLIHGAAVPHVWLHMTVDTTTEPATLHAAWKAMDGRPMWDLTVTTDDLRRPNS